MITQGAFTTGRSRSYCTAGEVMKMLRAYDLSSYGTVEEVQSRVQELLAVSRAAVEQYAGRDFWRHEEETVTLDGSGSNRLALTVAGVYPPVTVEAIRVEGRELAVEQWRVYETQGVVRLTDRATPGVFASGSQNVSVTGSWGPETLPQTVVQAQAKLTAAALLGEASGEAGEVTATRIGDYAVSYGKDGRFAGVVRRLVEEAEGLLGQYRRLGMQAV